MASLRLFLILLVTCPYYIYSTDNTHEPPREFNLGRVDTGTEHHLSDHQEIRKKKQQTSPYPERSSNDRNPLSRATKSLGMLVFADTDLDGINLKS